MMFMTTEMAIPVRITLRHKIKKMKALKTKELPYSYCESGCKYIYI